MEHPRSLSVDPSSPDSGVEESFFQRGITEERDAVKEAAQAAVEAERMTRELADPSPAVPQRKPANGTPPVAPAARPAPATPARSGADRRAVTRGPDRRSSEPAAKKPGSPVRVPPRAPAAIQAMARHKTMVGTAAGGVALVGLAIWALARPGTPAPEVRSGMAAAVAAPSSAPAGAKHTGAPQVSAAPTPAQPAAVPPTAAAEGTPAAVLPTPDTEGAPAAVLPTPDTEGAPAVPAVAAAPGTAPAAEAKPVVAPELVASGGSAEPGRPTAAAVAPTAPAAPEAQAAADESTARCRKALGAKKYREILDACPRAFEASPQSADLAVMIAEAEFNRGRVSQAVAWARKAVAVDPNTPEAYVFIGSAEQEAGRAQAAKAAYRKYLELAPAGRFAQDLRAIVGTL